MANVTAGSIVFDVRFMGKQAESFMARLHKNMQGLQKTARKNNAIFGNFGKILTVGGFTKIVSDSARFAHSMTVVAQQTGIAVRQLQTMRSAISIIGGDAKVIDKVTTNITEGLARTFTGNTSMLQKLQSMGISGYANGKARTPDDILYDIADYAQKQLSIGRSEMEVATFLKDSFGIDWEMFQSMKKGGKAYREILEATKQKVGEAPDTKNRDELFKSFNTLLETISINTASLVETIAPALTSIVNWIQNFSREHPIATNALMYGGGGLLGWNFLGKLFGGGSKGIGTATATATTASSGGGFLSSLGNLATALYAGKIAWDTTGTVYDAVVGDMEKRIDEAYKEKDVGLFDFGTHWTVIGSEIGKWLTPDKPIKGSATLDDYVDTARKMRMSGAEYKDVLLYLKEAYWKFHPESKGRTRAAGEFARSVLNVFSEESAKNPKGWFNTLNLEKATTESSSNGSSNITNNVTVYAGDITPENAEPVGEGIGIGIAKTQNGGAP